MIFQTGPETWQELEELVHQAFSEMGYEAHRQHQLDTVRGSVKVDVYARKVSAPIPTVVIGECKYWNRPVDQSVVHGFRTVCQDAGAHFGLIVSKEGFQSGSKVSALSTNVHLLDFEEFQTTFFEEWRSGAFSLLCLMRDEILPIFRATAGFDENGLDLVAKKQVEGLRLEDKYWLLWGTPVGEYFAGRSQFPFEVTDPRGDPRKLEIIEVKDYRHFFELCRQATKDAKKWFELPPYHQELQKFIS